MTDATRQTPTGIALDKVGKSFGSRRDPFVALRPTSLSVSSESRIGIIGESGSGKSTLAKLCVGLIEPSTGVVLSDGRDVQGLLKSKPDRLSFRAKAQYIPQDTTSSFDPRHRLLRSVIDPAIRLRGMSVSEAESEAMETIEWLGLPPDLVGRLPNHVSGGQRQRFSIARSLVVRPRILICDEVVSALDVSVQGSILNLLKQYCEDNNSGLVFVSHDIPATAFIADELIVMHEGRIVEKGPTDDVVSNPKHEYTRFLMDAYAGIRSAGLRASE